MMASRFTSCAGYTKFASVVRIGSVLLAVGLEPTTVLPQELSESQVDAKNSPGSLVVGPLAVESASGERSASPVYEEETQVLSTDFVFDPALLGRPGGRGIDSSTVSLSVNGVDRPITSASVALAGSWQVAIYFDATRLEPRAMRWAAGLLAESAARWGELGEIEIVMADPVPRPLLSASSDSDAATRALSQLALAPGETLHAVRDLREEYLATLENLGGAPPEQMVRLVPQLIAEEERLDRRRYDRLVSWLADAALPGAPRVLLLVSEGSDQDPGSFYQGSPDVAVGERFAARNLLLARIAASYGWKVYFLVPPSPPPPKDRIGMLRALEIRLDGNWDPDKADAFYLLGRSHRDRGELNAAIEAFRKAAYHYYDHPKFRTQQAAVLVDLGRVLEQLGQRVEARQMFAAAVALDASWRETLGRRANLLVEPLAGLERLARETGGRQVSTPAALAASLQTLGGSVRISFPLDGVVERDLLPLTLAAIGNPERSLDGWTRSGTPLAVSESRLGILLRDGLLAGELPLEVQVVSASNGDVEIATSIGSTPLPSAAGATSAHAARRTLRLSWAHLVGAGDGELETTHLEQSVSTVEDPLLWSLTGVGSNSGILVTLEDLTTGAWGSEWVELP